MTEQLLFWMVTGFVGALVMLLGAVLSFSINRLFKEIEDLKQSVHLIFEKIEMITGTFAKLNDLKDLEHRVRQLEDKTNKCKNCQ